MANYTYGPFKKLGTIWWFEFFDTAKSEADSAHKKLLGEMERFEATYSRFLDDSLIGRLNSGEALQNPSPELQDIISQSVALYKDTDGHFNITVAGELEKRGYGKGGGSDITDPETSIHVSGNYTSLEPGTKIDFGGIGKGYLVDILSKMLEQDLGVPYHLINAGGDIRATSNSGNSIRVGVTHPTHKDVIIGTIDLYNEAFAASSPHERSWSNASGTHHHLVGSHAFSSFVVAPNATQADAWATALSVGADLPSDLASGIIKEIDGRQILETNKAMNQLLKTSKKESNI